MNISLVNGAGLTATRPDATGVRLTKDNGSRLYISLSNPLAEGVAIDQTLVEHCKERGDLLLVLNELLVRKHIAAEITKVEAALNSI